MDLSNATPEQIERMKQRMREQGMTDEQIEDAIERRRQGGGVERRDGAPPR
jgi:hypothetical protein